MPTAVYFNHLGLKIREKKVQIDLKFNVAGTICSSRWVPLIMDKCFVETLRKWFLPQHRTIDDRMFRSCRLEANWQSTMGVTKMTQAAQYNLGDLLLPSALVREKRTCWADIKLSKFFSAVNPPFPRSNRSTGLHLSHLNIAPRSRMVNKDLSAVTEILIFKIMNGLRKCYLP